MTDIRERSYRGISERLAREYLSRLGGTIESDDRIVGDGWIATLSTASVSIGRSVTLTEVTVRFEGEREVLDDIIEAFGRKAMRAGG